MSHTEDLYKLFLDSTGVSTDTRSINEGNIFFALKGENFDGNKYAADALGKGASCAVIDDRQHKTEGAFLVEDVLSSLQALARHHRKHFHIPVIALTGTNGKTTTKELIREVLARKYRTHATQGNLNNHIGVPLTILGIKRETEIAVLEMGANHRGEIGHLCSIALPTHGMITNIGKAHLEGFGGYEGVIAAKSEMYAYLRESGGLAFVNADDEMLMDLSEGIKKFTYGRTAKADIRSRLSASLPFMGIEWNEMKIQTRMYGDYNFQNVVSAICIGSYFSVDAEAIAAAITAYTPSNNRSQVVKTDSNTIFLDAYNANPSSMMASISQFRQQEGINKAVIIGDMLELGEESQAEHKEIIKEIREGFSRVILVGPEFSKASAGQRYITFMNTAQAAAWLRENPLRNTSILIKGSRGIALEKLLPYL